MNLFPFIVSWAVLATFVIVLAIYRRMISPKEADEVLHVDAAFAARQETIDKRLTVIDRWGKTLTVVAVVYGLAVLAVFLYHGWQAGNTPQY